MHAGRYRGRFAPSPTGPLHLGSLVAALASWLDARAHHGEWLVRIEDIDHPRCVPGAAEDILHTLAALGLHPDAPPLWQSTRSAAYTSALDRLQEQGALYPCGCSRKEIAAALTQTRVRHQTLGYPGTCRTGLHGKMLRAWRVRVPEDGDDLVCFTDRWQGQFCQQLASEVGDFVLKRADGLWAYQLAVVVDDAEQGITHIVRGMDLLDSTPRQLYLQQLLGLPSPQYLHVPLILDAAGEKLSKQTGAPALDSRRPCEVLQQAARHLGLEVSGTDLPALLAQAANAWRERHGIIE
jgi:glutamyl-Q tRNA(Asp) synthetase